MEKINLTEKIKRLFVYTDDERKRDEKEFQAMQTARSEKTIENCKKYNS